jgi:Kyakuja-Dileera-Zisupton transposase
MYFLYVLDDSDCFYDRYANMDFIVFYTLAFSILTNIVFSYDIACQWYRNLKTRMLRLPREMWISCDLFNALLFFIPKVHIYAHGPKCQYVYSFNFRKWSARTDGEDPERFWSHINPASLSTREMSPGARFDALDSHAAHWNWRKITKLGISVLHKSVSKLIVLFLIYHRFIPRVSFVRSAKRTCTSSCLFYQALNWSRRRYCQGMGGTRDCVGG